MISIIGWYLYGIFSFNLSEGKFVLDRKIVVPNKAYSLEVYIYPSDATIQGSVSVQKLEGDSAIFLTYYERYNSVASSNLLGDSILELCLKDTNSYDLKVDTFFLRLP